MVTEHCESFGCVSWWDDDIIMEARYMRISITEAEAHELLEKCSRKIVDASIDCGMTIIQEELENFAKKGQESCKTTS